MKPKLLILALILATLQLSNAMDEQPEPIIPRNPLDNPLSFPDHNHDSLRTPSYKPSIFHPQLACAIDIKATPITRAENGQDMNASIPIPDEGVQIKNTHYWPNSPHGIIFARFSNTPKGQYRWGTGTLIAPNVVLTAAQNLYNHDIHNEQVVGKAIEIRFVPALYGFIAPFDEPSIERFHYPGQYEKDGTENFGILILEDIPRATEGLCHTGYLGLGILPASQFPNLELNITGYPAHKSPERQYIYPMRNTKGKATQIDNNFIHHTICTSKGQGGAGLWYQDDSGCYITGVLLDNGKAILLTKSRYDQILKWVEGDN